MMLKVSGSWQKLSPWDSMRRRPRQRPVNKIVSICVFCFRPTPNYYVCERHVSSIRGGTTKTRS